MSSSKLFASKRRALPRLATRRVVPECSVVLSASQEPIREHVAQPSSAWL